MAPPCARAVTEARTSHSGVSIGDAVQGDSDRLLAAADQALYRAKAAGKGRWAPAYDLTMPLPFPSDG